MAVAVLALCAMGGVQAATLTCGTPLRVTTTAASGWSTDARLADDTTVAATLVDNYLWSGWFDPATRTPPLTHKWLSFGAANTVNPATGSNYDAVLINGDTANGAWVNGRATIIYNETITVAPNVDLSTIRVTGSGSADNSALFVVKPATLPGNVANTTWVKTTSMLGLSYGSPDPINMVDGNLGFYYGDNTIGFALSSESTTRSLPAGVIADLEITADCLTEPAAQPTAPLICPVGNAAGDTVRIGPFTTNARDWKWTWRNNAGTLENVEQPLFDDYRFRSYFNPADLPAGSETTARWISPGTTSPAGGDVPGVPYPAATGQSKGATDGSMFVMSTPINVGNNVDLATIRLEGRFGFDDYGNSVSVQPAAASAPIYTAGSAYLPNGYGAFQSSTTPAIAGFERGQNTIGFLLDGGQNTNDCGSGLCALGAIAEFYVTATCTGVPPVSASAAKPVPALDTAGIGLLGLLSAGLGALALRRRNRAAR